jgi:phytoene dehydrogenase-like protein
MTDFDADTIVIGSGSGGLTSGLALARAGQKVMVLGQHYAPGGWCHNFSKGVFYFQPRCSLCRALGSLMVVLFDRCGIALVLKKMPWNKQQLVRVIK